MKTILFTSTFDSSGYGNTAKKLCMALIRNNFNVYTNIVSIPMSKLNIYDTPKEILQRNKIIKADINICEQVPLLWPNSFQKGSYNIGRLYWETTKLPSKWIDIINNGLCNEIWASCEWNKQVYLDSGVKKPIYIVPPISDFQTLSIEDSINTLPIPQDNHYKFYCIAQYTKRKGIDELLHAYFSEFDSSDNVLLVLKLHGIANVIADKHIIREKIQSIKERYINPPSVFFIGDMLTTKQISAIHKQCDCYVSPHRGEGWSMPIAEAMANQKQICTTKLGGITDDLDENSAYIIPHSFEPVSGMPFNIYDESMHWGQIEVTDVQKAMRRAYNERTNYSERLAKYKNILDVCNEEHVVKLMNERLNQVL